MWSERGHLLNDYRSKLAGLYMDIVERRDFDRPLIDWVFTLREGIKRSCLAGSTEELDTGPARLFAEQLLVICLVCISHGLVYIRQDCPFQQLHPFHFQSAPLASESVRKVDIPVQRTPSISSAISSMAPIVRIQKGLGEPVPQLLHI
jgi:hypothetical protein